MTTSSAAIQAIARDGYSLSAAASCDGAMRVTMVGNFDVEATPVLGSFLDELSTKLKLSLVHKVVFDCQRVEFLNSASIKAFVMWIVRLRAQELAEWIEVRFVTSESQRWQERSLDAVRRFAPELVKLVSGP